MRTTELIVFDDALARDWMPFALTGPVGELRFGAYTLAGRASLALGVRVAGHLTAEHLQGYDEPGAAPVLRLDELATDRDRVFLSSRAVLEPIGEAASFGREPAAIRVDGELCGWFAPAGSPAPEADFFLDPAANLPAGAAEVELDGVVLDRPWRLISGNATRLERDILGLAADPAGTDGRSRLGPGVHVLGDGPLLIGEGAEIEPGVVIDLRSGPVWIGAGATVQAFTRLAGPVHLAEGSTILGGPFEASSIGPRCKVRGEVEASVIVGYSNKAHEGFLGHAYVGRWVNLGAATNNSDLKNNYGTIRLWTPTGEVDTGETKVGCLLGDHVKTAIGTLLNTGTVVGAGANLFGSGQPPKHVAAFAWGHDEGAGRYDIDRFLETASVVMKRRDVELSEGQRAVLRRAWELSGSVES